MKTAATRRIRSSNIHYINIFWQFYIKPFVLHFTRLIFSFVWNSNYISIFCLEIILTTKTFHAKYVWRFDTLREIDFEHLLYKFPFSDKTRKQIFASLLIFNWIHQSKTKNYNISESIVSFNVPKTSIHNHTIQMSWQLIYTFFSPPL